MKKALSLLLVLALALTLGSAAFASGEASGSAETAEIVSDKAYIEETLNIANNDELTWTYASGADAWTMSVVSAVVYPELPNQQGVSVCVPGAYVTGIDTDGDGAADVTAASYAEPVNGVLVIDYDAEITSTNGQVYTAATAPVILNTGAAGYGSQSNRAAGTTYAKEGYVNVSCGNRGKQDAVKDDDGNVLYYTGDAPSCLVDQKNAARFVKYNILLGNLPGGVDYMVSTGGSGGAAHAAMFAATSNNPDFYDYEIEAGAVGVYATADGGYSTTVTIDGVDYDISDGAWGCVAYSAITSLYEGDITMAFEYYLNPDYSFNTDFQKQLAAYLSELYMEYINGKGLSVAEAAVGFDLNGDGDQDDTIDLTIEYDPDLYPETNGYHGAYLDLYLAEFTENIQWYVDNLDYASGYTWFKADGTAMSDAEVANMTAADKAAAFIEGRYNNGSSSASSGPSGAPGGASGNTTTVNGVTEMTVGTPDAGTTQAAGSGTNSKNYASFDEMLAAYEADIAEVLAGDRFGKNQVSLYNPLNYIGAEGTDDPVWTRVVMGEKEGDMGMMASLNMQIAWLAAGTDAVVEWQYNGGHVPSEVLGNSFALWVDQMYAEHVEGALPVKKAPAEHQMQNGDAEEMTGADISDWVSLDENGQVSVTLKDAAAYRTNNAMKATPGFDVIDYGQEDYVFGSAEKDARHWDVFVLEAMQEHADVLAGLF